MSKDKEEVDYYAQKKIPALVIWYLAVVDRLRSLFANPEDAKLMSWRASDEHKMMASFAIQPMESSGKISMTTTETLLANQGMLGLHCV